MKIMHTEGMVDAIRVTFTMDEARFLRDFLQQAGNYGVGYEPENREAHRMATLLDDELSTFVKRTDESEKK